MKSAISMAIAAIALILPQALQSQQKGTQKAAPSAVLEYFENPSGGLSIFDQNRRSISFEVGTRIMPGWTIVTEQGDTVELRLDPNGSIVKVAQMTNFKVESLQGPDAASNVFSVAIGKVRAVAGRATGQEKYGLKGPTAVCGVRGTDFGLEVGAYTQIAFALDGSIDYARIETGETIGLEKGMMADASALVFTAKPISKEIRNDVQTELRFIRLNPFTVPGIAVTQAPGPEPIPVAPAAAPVAPVAAVQETSTDGLLTWMQGEMEIGALIIDGVFYARAVLSPRFDWGEFSFALYLPVICKGNIFDPDSYYRPAGNNEWDFGFVSGDWDAHDFYRDLMLKIKYAQWGSKGKPIYARIGNLEGVTIGHGLVMSGFDNNVDFPAVRRLGLELEMDFETSGFQAMTDDCTDPRILGGRVYFRPFGGYRAEIGMSLVADINSLADYTILGEDAAPLFGRPIFIIPGLDMEFPFAKSESFSISGFADFAVRVPYLQSDTDPLTSVSVPAGFRWNAIWDQDSERALKNYGIMTGVFGKASSVDFRLDYRYYTGAFRPALYDAMYSRDSVQSVMGNLLYLDDPSNSFFNRVGMAIYAEAGVTLKEAIGLKIGYLWPWQVDTGGNLGRDDYDRLVVKITLPKGAIPNFGLSGFISFERNCFISTINGTAESDDFFDANTVVRAQLSYAVIPSMDLVLLYTTMAGRDSSGTVTYSDTSALPEMDWVLYIGAEIHL